MISFKTNKILNVFNPPKIKRFNKEFTKIIIFLTFVIFLDKSSKYYINIMIIDLFSQNKNTKKSFKIFDKMNNKNISQDNFSI